MYNTDNTMTMPYFFLKSDFYSGVVFLLLNISSCLIYWFQAFLLHKFQAFLLFPLLPW